MSIYLHIFSPYPLCSKPFVFHVQVINITTIRRPTYHNGSIQNHHSQPQNTVTSHILVMLLVGTRKIDHLIQRNASNVVGGDSALCRLGVTAIIAHGKPSAIYKLGSLFLFPYTISMPQKICIRTCGGWNSISLSHVFCV